MSVREEVPIANIESELATLWEDEKSSNRIRACLFNLIVYTQEERQVAFLDELIDSTLEKFPCRIIYIKKSADPESNYIRAYISNEGSSGKNSPFGCDQITIEVSANRTSEIPYIVLPHLVPDLPIYLIWPQGPTGENKLLPYLQTFSNRLIFDPGCANNLQRFAQDMIARIASVKAEIVDISWGLISGWRDVIARTFDTKERIQQLSFCKHIKITYNDTKNPFFQYPEIQAIYLNCWLASQLGWRFVDIHSVGHTRHLNYTNSTSHIAVVLSPQVAEGLLPGAITGLEVTTNDNHFYFISRKQKQPKVTVHISTAETCELPFTLPLQNTQVGLGFIKGLFYQSSCEHYHNMLKMVSQIDWRVCEG